MLSLPILYPFRAICRNSDLPEGGTFLDITTLPAGTAAPFRTIPAPMGDDTAMRRAADAFEASFLAEMLKGAGLGKTPDAFGGGAGEDQFASFLRQEQARGIVRAGGIGLSETIFQALQEAQENG